MCASRTACAVDFAGRVTDVLISDFLTSMKLFITLSLEIKRKSVNTLCFAMLGCNLILTSVRVQVASTDSDNFAPVNDLQCPQYEQSDLLGSGHDERHVSDMSESEGDASGTVSTSDSDSDVNDVVEVYTEIEASLTEENLCTV